MSLKPTPARVALAKAIAAGRVTYYRRWGHDPDEVKWDRKRVTGPYRQFEAAKLVTLGPAEHPSAYAPKPVQLTPEGVAWLAEHGQD